jgi:hypothetical protein
VHDKRDGRAALTALSRLDAPPENRFLHLRVGLLRADAYVVLGKPDSARAALQQLARDYPELQKRMEDRINQIK